MNAAGLVNWTHYCLKETNLFELNCGDDDIGNHNKIRSVEPIDYDKKTELRGEDRIPIFFFDSPPLRDCDIHPKGKNIICLKIL